MPENRWKRAQNIDYASTAFAGRETQRFPPLFSRTVVVGFSSDLPADVIAIWLKPPSGSQPTSLQLCRQLPARSGGGTLGHKGREEFSPFIGPPNKTSISKSVNGGSSAGRRSGRSAPSRTLSHHVERYSRRQFSTVISKDRWRTSLEVMFQRGSAGRSRPSLQPRPDTTLI